MPGGRDTKANLQYCAGILAKELEDYIAEYRQERWSKAQAAARVGLEAIAMSLAQGTEGAPPKGKKQSKLDYYLDVLRRHHRVDTGIQQAFSMVRTMGNLGAHAQSEDAAPTRRHADLCASSLAVMVEWWLDTIPPQEEPGRARYAELARQLRLLFSEGVSETETLNVSLGNETEEMDSHPRQSPLPLTFADWYPDVRAELASLMPEEIGALETAEGWLQADGRATPALRVCVIGQAAVGKSTLINSLVSRDMPVLPAGGTGPHTASAIVVRYSQAPHVEVRYLDMQRVEELRDALREQPPRLDALAAVRMLLEGDQFAPTPVPELAQKLDAILDESAPPEHAEMASLWEVVAALRADNRVLHHPLEQRAAFMGALEDHARGYLAPLTESVEVGWSADLLIPGLSLVDLPGFGIAHDKHNRVTRRELERARGVLWVVDRAGLTEATLGELRRIEFFRRLANEESAESLMLFVAVSRLDESARERRKRFPAGQRPTFEQALSEVSEECRRMIRTQLRDALTHLDDDERERALERVEVFGVAPTEYRKLSSDDEEEPARVDDPESTGVPVLARALRRRAAHRRARAATAIDTLLERARATNRPLADRLRRELIRVTPDPEAIT